jgi:hypothetical protein
MLQHVAVGTVVMEGRGVAQALDQVQAVVVETYHSVVPVTFAMSTTGTNPMIEFILNLFGYTYQSKPSLLLMSMVDFTHESYFQGVQRQGRLSEFQKYI